jgi:hypothetical protein
VPGLMVVTNKCERLINFVMVDKPKVLRGLNQKVRSRLISYVLGLHGHKGYRRTGTGLTHQCYSCGTWVSAGINRHRVGDEITLHERRSYSIMAPSHARAIAR